MALGRGGQDWAPTEQGRKMGWLSGGAGLEQGAVMALVGCLFERSGSGTSDLGTHGSELQEQLRWRQWGNGG